MSRAATPPAKAPTPTSEAPRPDLLSPASSTDSSSTLHGPSPLNPNASPPSTPKTGWTSLPSSATSSPSGTNRPLSNGLHRPFTMRGNTASQPRSSSPSARAPGTARGGTYPMPAAAGARDAAPRSRDRSPAARRTPSPAHLADITPTSRVQTPPGAPSQDWWDTSVKRTPRGWDDGEPKRKRTVPGEQVVTLQHTRERVVAAAKSVLGNTLDVTHEALVLSTEFLDFAPVPGLALAAKTLLNIWDALEGVDSNRMACLRLTERCADILSGIREEIVEAGIDVAHELRDPITKLVDSFIQVQQFMIKQAHRPFLKRYLKRDEILREIAGCDTALSDSLYLFSTSIQIRILKQMQENETRRQADTNALAGTLLGSPAGQTQHPTGPLAPLGLGLGIGLLHPDPASQSTDTLTPIKMPEPEGPWSIPSIAPPTDPTGIRSRYSEVVAQQNLQDRTLDELDLRAQMRGAMQAGDDAALLDTLEIPRAEIPDAMKSLQRALEREVDQESDADSQEREKWAASVRSLRNVASVESIASEASEVPSLSDSWTTTDSSGRSRVTRDTLDREFMECGIDAMRRLSRGNQFVSLPSWTITKYEISRDVKIGIGSFSDVYRGTWRGRTVAIKVLIDSTPRELFVREIEIWKTLMHRNVLCLFGASSAAGEPPYFFVSPYYTNGSLVKYLTSLPSLSGLAILKMLHEIAKGMQYLHGKNVLHGDLKATNILVDDKLRCVIADFGQSKLKSEAYRRSGSPHTNQGALRWQAPELMQGLNHLTPEVDIYAFAICCVEILGKGGVPWSVVDDNAVYRLVVERNQRPDIPDSWLRSRELDELIQACWDRDPKKRPPFSEVASRLKQMRAKVTVSFVDEPTVPPPEITIDPPSYHKSPSTLPIELPEDMISSTVSLNVPGAFKDPTNPLEQTPPETNKHGVEFPFSRKGSITDELESEEASEHDQLAHLDASMYLTPEPEDSTLAATRNERRYRYLLQHEFHPTLILPLWSPSPVNIGAVGFLEKPSGSFRTFFNAFNPSAVDGPMKDAPSIYGYGRVNKGSQRAEKRSHAQRGLDSIQDWFISRISGSGSKSVSRQYTYQLRTGHKAAFLCTETTMYNYLDTLDAPKRWFKTHIDDILKAYGQAYNLQKEDVLLVVGTLDTPEHAQYVSHSHPDGQLHFNVFAVPPIGQPWGEFVHDAHLSPTLASGPSYLEAAVPSVYASKVMDVRRATSSWDSVLLARLRFKTDGEDPTSR